MNKQRVFALLLAAALSMFGSVTAFAEGEGAVAGGTSTAGAPAGGDTQQSDDNSVGDAEGGVQDGTQPGAGDGDTDTPPAGDNTIPVAPIQPAATTLATPAEEDAATATVTDAAGLTAALENENVTTIVLGADITASITIPQGRTLTLDLGGYTLTNEESKHTITNNGHLTIQGSGTVDNVSHGKGALVNGGTVIMNGGTLTRSGEKGSSPADNGGNSWYVVDNNGGTMTVNGGLITNTSYHSSLIRNLNATFNMDGGELTNPFIVLKNDDNGVVNITDGTISTTAAGGSALQNWGKATVSGGVLEAPDNAVAIFALEWSEKYDPSVTTVLDGAVVNGDIAVCKDSNYPEYQDSPEVKVQGGEVNGNITARDYADVTVSGGTVTGTVSASGEKSELKVEGGKFVQKPDAEYVDAGAGIVAYTAPDGETAYFYGDDAREIDAEPGATVTVEKGENITVTGTDVTIENKTGAPITVNNSTVADGGNVVINRTPSRDSDSDDDYYGTETWDDVKEQIADADDGDTIKLSGTGLDRFPGSVARALKGRDVTLEIRKGGVTYRVNGLEIGSVDKLWYEFENIETQLLTAKSDKAEPEADADKQNPDTGR